MVVRLKVDENLPGEIADLLNALGHDAATVAQQGLQGTADHELWQHVQKERRWLVTADKEFADLRRYPPGSHAGLLLLRAAEEGLDHYLNLAETALRRMKLEELIGAVVVVSPRRIRVRRAEDS